MTDIPWKASMSLCRQFEENFDLEENLPLNQENQQRKRKT
jgi:hypothetical protein